MRSKYLISGGRFTNYIAINWYQYLTLCTGMLLITFTFDRWICNFVQWFKWVHLCTEASWSYFFCRIEMCTHHFLPEASIGLRVLSSPVCACLSVHFLACSRACASKVFSLRADCGRVIVYPGLKQWERPRHNIFGVCTRLAGGVCMSTSANSSASKHLTVTKIVWKIVYVTFDYLISHFFKILSLEFMANLFRDFRASVSLKVFHYRLRGKWCQYDLEIN